MSGDRNRSSRVDAEIVEKQSEALRLLLRGYTYQKIADHLGYRSRQGAHDAVKSALNRAKAERMDLADRVLDMQIGRYQDLLTRSLNALDEAEEGREVGRAQLIGAARGVLDSLSRLYGLDKPSAVVSVRPEAGLSADLARLAAFVAEGDGSGSTDGESGRE